MCIGGILPYFYGANSVWIACIDHAPSPMQGVLIVSIGLKGAQRGEGKEAIVSETCGRLGGQGENEESPAVQSGRALPMVRCASPPPPPEVILRLAKRKQNEGVGNRKLNFLTFIFEPRYLP